jgi:hypothetical protein
MALCKPCIDFNSIFEPREASPQDSESERCKNTEQKQNPSSKFVVRDALKLNRRFLTPIQLQQMLNTFYSKSTFQNSNSEQVFDRILDVAQSVFEERLLMERRAFLRRACLRQLPHSRFAVYNKFFTKYQRAISEK